MPRVDDIFAYLAGRPASCSTCGCVLIALPVHAMTIQVCPSCDETPGARPRRGDEAVPHSRLHFTEIPGCPECVEARRMRL